MRFERWQLRKAYETVPLWTIGLIIKAYFLLCVKPCRGKIRLISGIKFYQYFFSMLYLFSTAYSFAGRKGKICLKFLTFIGRMRNNLCSGQKWIGRKDFGFLITSHEEKLILLHNPSETLLFLSNDFICLRDNFRKIGRYEIYSQESLHVKRKEMRTWEKTTVNWKWKDSLLTTAELIIPPPPPLPWSRAIP